MPIIHAVSSPVARWLCTPVSARSGCFASAVCRLLPGLVTAGPVARRPHRPSACSSPVASRRRPSRLRASWGTRVLFEPGAGLALFPPHGRCSCRALSPCHLLRRLYGAPRRLSPVPASACCCARWLCAVAGWSVALACLRLPPRALCSFGLRAAGRPAGGVPSALACPRVAVSRGSPGCTRPCAPRRCASRALALSSGASPRPAAPGGGSRFARGPRRFAPGASFRVFRCRGALRLGGSSRWRPLRPSRAGLCRAVAGRRRARRGRVVGAGGRGARAPRPRGRRRRAGPGSAFATLVHDGTISPDFEVG